MHRGLAPSREAARETIAAGRVTVAGAPADKPARLVDSGDPIVVAPGRTWASRGAHKLDAALTSWPIAVADRRCLDAGASTGGFTDVLLTRGAAFVYAIDVGRGQLDPRLANDPRVHVMDRTNLRSLTSLPGAPPDLVTLDLSFISLRLVIPAVVRLVSPDGADLVALFKPQFELGREAIGKGGIVRDAAAAERGARDFASWLESGFGAVARAPMPSPVRGAKGNLEWLVGARLVGLPSAGPGEP